MTEEIRRIIDKVAQSYYERTTYVPEGANVSFLITSHWPQWERLPERDREKYRQVVAPMVRETLQLAGIEDVA